jgi:DMSO reductase family type II enzyme chaperone
VSVQDEPGFGSAEARLYTILAELISFPSDDLGEFVASGMVATTVGELASRLPWAPELPLLTPAPLPSPGEVEAAYICLFDVPDRMPTPLYTGVYAPRRRDAMEELLRTYRHFGLTVSDDAHDLPDFVPTVLEFLGFLAEDAAGEGGSSRESRERAMADVLERHLGPWATETSTRLAKREALRFYAQVVESIAALAASRLSGLRQQYPSARAAMSEGYRPSR